MIRGPISVVSSTTIFDDGDISSIISRLSRGSKSWWEVEVKGRCSVCTKVFFGTSKAKAMEAFEFEKESVYSTMRKAIEFWEGE